MWHEALCSPIHTNVASRAPCGLAGSRMVLSSSTHNPHNSDRGSIIIIIIMFYPPFKHYSGVRWQHLTVEGSEARNWHVKQFFALILNVALFTI